MQRSESIINLITALNKFQAIMPMVGKKADNPYFRSKYADMASIWEAIQAPLTENGLSVSQLLSTTDDGHGTKITTVLFHNSGEWLSEMFTVFPRPEKPKPDERGQDQAPFVGPQALGSASTYGRRYALCGILGIVTDDDDGNAADGRTNDRPAGKTKPKPEEPAPTNGDTRPGDTRTLKEAKAALDAAEAKPEPPKPENERKELLDAISARMQALIRPDNPKKTALQKVLMVETFGAEKWSAVLQLPLDQLRAGLAKLGPQPAPTNGDGPAADIGF